MRGLCQRASLIIPAALLSVAVAGCEFEKSSNPLSPTIAGPIAGVNITAPKPLEPSNGMDVLKDQQPVSLLFENASSNSERPFWYEVQVAADAGFSSLVYSAPRVTPATGGRTSFRLPDPLEAGRLYYWRVRADDGANASAFSAAASFNVAVPIVIDPPVPLSPTGGQTITTTTPDFVVTNGKVSGPAGPVAYRFQVAADAAFTQVAAVITVPRSAEATTKMSLGTLPYDRMVYWRAIATDNVVTSNWSQTAAFKTPAAPPPPPPPAPPPTTPAPTTPGPTSPSPTTPTGPAPRRPAGAPLPDVSGIISGVAGQTPGALQNSCQDSGGSWNFMDLVVDTLRAKDDTRWGYNWKRGFHQGYSNDVIDYHYGSDPDEGSPRVYVIDIIGGHCGPNPNPIFNDVTSFGPGAWTGRGRF